MQHIKKLDSLRAIAAILVIFWHWIPVTSFINTFDNGAIGVNIFFVLSGFLISRILMTNRDEAQRLKNNKLVVFKNFYVRRALRIFPVYYFLVLLIFFFHKYLGAKFTRPEFINSVSYTINFYFFHLKHWGDLTVHFWSLAVEEQFYLLWPFVILFINKKYLIHGIIFFIMVGIVSQCLMQSQEFGHIPTYTCFDSFGLGALLAWITLYKPPSTVKLYKVLRVLSIVCVAILILQAIYGRWEHFPQRTVHSIIALWMITYVLLNRGKGWFSFSSFLNNRSLFFLGKISYGIYLYHVPVQWLGFMLSPFITKILPGFLRPYNGYFLFVINFFLLVLIAWLSWRIIEKPILGLKKYFDYQNEKQPDTENKTVALNSVSS
jgi:peptidoglycan/LPS O-acetylase OafA/YrhL